MSASTTRLPRESLFLHHLTSDLWQFPPNHLQLNRFKREAGAVAESHLLPTSLDEWKGREAELRALLRERLHLGAELPPLEVEEHGKIECEGYTIYKYSFLGTELNRIPVNLYVPEGEGPFPAVLNVHGHHLTGKIAPRVQERGHLLALSGIAVLCVDAAGAGERGETEREWVYHGAAKAAEMFLYGDSLLGQQVRDNSRCVDFLQSLPFIDRERIGVTGASGGGNQAMWVAALDERLKAVVSVVSVGSFEAYVTRCNCVCETLPGFLQEAEEWAILGLIAPRPLLVLNALHDQPAFGTDVMSGTCRNAQEIYRLYGKREACDYRILNSTHGYFPEGQEAMLGWMKHWLLGAARSTSEALPVFTTLPPDDLICFPKGERPATLDYRSFRRERLSIAQQQANGGREALSALIGWQPVSAAQFTGRRELGEGVEATQFVSSRGIPIPVKMARRGAKQLRLILSPEGKGSAFSKAAAEAAGGESLVLIDLPATGELAWEGNAAGGARQHDSSRAALWLGYTQAQEWAEVIAALLAALRAEAPDAEIIVQAQADAAFAALLAQALQPTSGVVIEEDVVPDSLLDETTAASLVWHVPGFLGWGDVDTLRALAQENR